MGGKRDTLAEFRYQHVGFCPKRRGGLPEQECVLARRSTGLQEVRAMFRGRDYFILTAALISFLLSVYLWFGGQREAGMFVGIWVPSILAFGAFAKAGGIR
jgi:hypothetical protein